MATKYAGQNALNKLMQLVKTALNNKADKTNATTSAAGLMSATDKTKLDGIEAGATKTTVDAALDAGSANPVQNKAVKAALDEKLDKSGGTIAGNVIVEGTVEAEGSITIREAGSLAHIGLMPSGDNAASIVSTSSTGKSGNARLVVGTPTGDNDATTKAYVDSKIAAGGVTVDDSVSDTSTNPVQNKVIKTELDKKLDKSGGTVSGNLTVTGNVTSSGTVDGQMISGQTVTAYSSDHKKQIALECTGQNAGRFSGEVSGGVLHYARMAAATPTDDNDAATKAYVDGKVSGLQTADQVQTAINSAISGVYTPKGSIAFASLPTAAAGNKGWVYNVTDAFTTTAAFVEGAGHAYGAGTNVVCVDVGSGSYKWDVLAGTIDLTELTADEVQTLWDSI